MRKGSKGVTVVVGVLIHCYNTVCVYMYASVCVCAFRALHKHSSSAGVKYYLLGLTSSNATHTR